MTFKELGLSEAMLKGLGDLGFNEPTPVQEKSIPKVLDQKDVIVLAKTGSGKTGAFGIPIVEKIDVENKQVQALILTPTRELAVQVNKDLQSFCKHMKVRTTVVYGGHNFNKEMDAIANGAQIVTGTPGRVLDHLTRGTLRPKNIKFFVLDEADRMLDMGFIDQMKNIIKLLPRRRTTMLFSATMPKPIQYMSKSYMYHPETIEFEVDTKTVDLIKQGYYRTKRNEKNKRLLDILHMKEPGSCMVFCNTKFGVDRVQRYLYERGYMTEALHGDKTQNRRLRTIDNFKKGQLQVLVATDVAARGIHINDMELVINYDVPEDKDAYVHRVGRTGRAGNEGEAISLVTSEDIMQLYEIEEHIGAMIEEYDEPTDDEVREAMKVANGPWVEKRKSAKQKRKEKAHQKDRRNKEGDSRRTNRKDHRSHSKPQDRNKQGAKARDAHKSRDGGKRVSVKKRDQNQVRNERPNPSKPKVQKEATRRPIPPKKPQVKMNEPVKDKPVMKGYVREVKDGVVRIRRQTFMEKVKSIFK